MCSTGIHSNLINFTHHSLPTTISIDVECRDDNPVQNLLNEYSLFSNNGVICESFTRPPITIKINFGSNIDIFRIYVDGKVGQQQTRNFEISTFRSKELNSNDQSNFIGRYNTDKSRNVLIENKGFIHYQNDSNVKVDTKFNGDDLDIFQVPYGKYRFMIEINQLIIKLTRTTQSDQGSYTLCALRRVEVWGQQSSSRPQQLFTSRGQNRQNTEDRRRAHRGQCQMIGVNNSGGRARGNTDILASRGTRGNVARHHHERSRGIKRVIEASGLSDDGGCVEDVPGKMVDSSIGGKRAKRLTDDVRKEEARSYQFSHAVASTSKGNFYRYPPESPNVHKDRFPYSMTDQRSKLQDHSSTTLRVKHVHIGQQETMHNTRLPCSSTTEIFNENSQFSKDSNETTSLTPPPSSSTSNSTVHNQLHKDPYCNPSRRPQSQEVALKHSASTEPSIPIDFLDSLTHSMMLVPMILPSGHNVDCESIRKADKLAQDTGRPPFDPFTGVPYTRTNLPKLNIDLQRRIHWYLSMQRKTSNSLFATIDGKIENSMVIGGTRSGTSRLINNDVNEPYNNNPFDKKN